ncbi:DsrE family protein [Desulfogranum japonicum]|uniref:DsrE family protein n=1 Tax=Desulfogranum japonicum TaxID=231447 RepID=UPI0004212175|nr:DsrE family protein [Desulfogranum japonicum]
MKNNYLLLISAILILCGVGALPVVAATEVSQHEEPMDDLVLSMSTDNTQVVDGAIMIGTVALKRGHKVTMLLRLDSIKVAVAGSHYPVGNTDLAEKLSTFMQNGAKIMVGGHCMKSMGVKPQDLLPGITVGSPDLVMGTIFKKDTKILSY